MRIINLDLTNFRNYKKKKFFFYDYINIFYGDNGVGKTNILEAIYLLLMSKSHRSYIDTNLIRNNEVNAKIVGDFVYKTSEFEKKIEISRTGKKLFIEGDQIYKASEYIKKSRVIIFYPDDVDLVRGNPGKRRRYLNLLISQLNSSYLEILNKYNFL